VEPDSEIRPLPEPPRCRGISIGDGNYTGCAYGYGDLTPLTGPCDCPVCHGSGYEGFLGTMLPHSDFGDKDCCGCLNGIFKGDLAEITCNECGAVLRIVPAADLSKVFDEMELTLAMATEMCPHCKAANLFPGFTKMMAYTCKECGKGVTVSDEG
jgi:uncharacterized protein (DUF983 family)